VETSEQMSAVERLAASVSEIAGADVELERPKDPAHGAFATAWTFSVGEALMSIASTASAPTAIFSM
jgi:hypothetical protein